MENVVESTFTDSLGNYNIIDVQIEEYNLFAEKTGISPHLITDIPNHFAMGIVKYKKNEDLEVNFEIKDLCGNLYVKDVCPHCNANKKVLRIEPGNI